jgi:hypothetical protein
VVQSVGGKTNLYLNSQKDYRSKENLAVVLPTKAQTGPWAKVGPDAFVGKAIRATGKVSLTKQGAAQLEIADEKGLEIVKE